MAVAVLALAGASVPWWWPSAGSPRLVHEAATTGAAVTGARGPNCAGTPPGCGSGPDGARALADGTWSLLPPGPLGRRTGQASVWTGRQLLIWGGASSSGPVSSYHQVPLADGAAYDPVSRHWSALPAGPLSARSGSAAAWAGDEAVFWGGERSTGVVGQPAYLSDGAAYDPARLAWSRLAASPLTARSGAQAFWTGSQVILLGGRSSTGQAVLTDGAAYSPTTQVWTRLPAFPVAGTGGGVPVGMTAVWTGRRLLAWATYQRTQVLPGGGHSVSGHQVAASWAPGSASWRRLPSPPVGVPTFGARATWTGHEVVLLGGTFCLPSMMCPPPLTGALSTYDPATGHWGTSASDVVVGAAGPAAWTGAALVVLNEGAMEGGPGAPVLSPGDGAAYDPASGAWAALARSPLADLVGATMVWTGGQIIVWGGGAGDGPGLGAALTPGPSSTPSSTTPPSTTPPSTTPH